MAIMSQATLEKYEAVKKLIESGETAENAAKKIGMAYSNFYRIRKQRGETISRGLPSRKTKPVVALPLVEQETITFTMKQLAEFARECARG